MSAAQKPIPVFETERLILRAVTEADAPAYERHFVDYEVIRYLNDAIPWPYPEGGVLAYLKSDVLSPPPGKQRWHWGVFLKTQPDELIGMIDIFRPGSPSNRGFWLGRKFWGQGYMSEALEPVMDYAFDVLDFETFVLSNAVGNKRSRRLKEKFGARLLEVKPAKFVDPDYTEHEVWELTKENWRLSKTI